MSYEICASGTITADGTEQTIAELEEATRISGYLSLSNMQAGDILVVRQYFNFGTANERYASATYSGAQSDPIIYFTPKEIAPNTKITIQQTAGTYRSYQYEILKEVDVVGAGFVV